MLGRRLGFELNLRGASRHPQPSTGRIGCSTVLPRPVSEVAEVARLFHHATRNICNKRSNTTMRRWMITRKLSKIMRMMWSRQQK
jgi:hypothetical protein